MDDLGTVFSFFSLNLPNTLIQIHNLAALSHITFQSINYSKEHKLGSLYNATSFLPAYFPLSYVLPESFISNLDAKIKGYF